MSIGDGGFNWLVLPHVNGDCMALFLAEIAARYPNESIVVLLDGAGWHKSQTVTLPANIGLLYLPPYSPQINPVEHL